MSAPWIVHRDPRQRTALRRLAAAPERGPCGAPGDRLFESAPAPSAIVLGLAGDFEAELHFAHRVAARYPAAHWILVAERGDAAAARRLFDTLPAEIVTYPPDARLLRGHLRDAMRYDGPRLPLSQRPVRDEIADRFSRWFADLELPEVMRALDPQLGGVPVLIRGEPGTGRGLLARYLHCFGSASEGPFCHVVCESGTSPAALGATLRDAAEQTGGARDCTVWLEDLDRLPRATQRRLMRWIEFAPPTGLHRSQIARWLATASEEGLDDDLEPALRDALGAISVHVPSVRERPHFIATFANDTARALCSARRMAARRFGEDAVSVLEEYPWPGNLRELEAVVIETLAAGSADPIRADDLQYDGAAFAPLDAGEIGQLIEPRVDPPSAPPPTSAPPVKRDPPNGGSGGSGGSLRESAHAAESARGGESRLNAGSTAGSDRPPLTPVEIASEPVDVAAAPAAAARERETSAPPADAPTSGPNALQHMVRAIAHETRNPLSTIRTFVELLPERYDDPEFRSRFAELVGRDAKRLEGVVTQLSELAAMEPPRLEPVDVAALLDEVLDRHRERVRAGKLVVLKELDRDGTVARADAAQLRLAFGGVIDRALRLAPERGDVYVAARRHKGGLRESPSVRVVIRFGRHQGPGQGLGRPRVPGVSLADNALEFAIAEAIVRGQHGRFSIDTVDDDETVVRCDLPTPS